MEYMVWDDERSIDRCAGDSRWTDKQPSSNCNRSVRCTTRRSSSNDAGVKFVRTEIPW